MQANVAGAGRSRGWPEPVRDSSDRCPHIRAATEGLSCAFLSGLISDRKTFPQVLRFFDFIHDGHGVILSRDAAFTVG